jgi:hypothetical protein
MAEGLGPNARVVTSGAQSLLSEEFRSQIQADRDQGLRSREKQSMLTAVVRFPGVVLSLDDGREVPLYGVPRTATR